MSEGMRILVIDDDPDDRLALRRAIEDSDLAAEICEAASASAAMAASSESATACVLLDHELEGTSALEIVRQVRALGNLTPIVFLVDDPSEDLLQLAVDAGVTDFFPRSHLAPRRLALRIRFAIRAGLAEAESARAVATATRAAAARDDILAVVSHDLRGPLHAISLACEALHEEATGEALRYLGAIDRASQRAERLISDLLEAAAIENGALTLNRGSIDLAAVVRQAAADHELLAREPGAKLTAHVPDEITIVSADRDRVLQVLGNLIGNALKHARGAAIDIVVTRRDHEAVIAVRDKGPGISQAELPHVFDRYWHGRTKKGGAGLGLAITKGIVEAHGGRVAAASRQGEGTEISFTLPLARR